MYCKMQKTCSFFILLLHGIISVLAETGFTKQDSTIFLDDVCKLWTLMLGFIVVGEFGCTRAHVRGSRFNHHVFCVCFSVLANTIVLHYTCPVIGYCFLLHSITSVCSNVLSDVHSALFSRICGGFVLVFTYLGICFIPKPLEMMSKVYFIDYKSKAYHDLSFETAHLFAIFVSIIVDIVVEFVDFVFA